MANSIVPALSSFAPETAAESPLAHLPPALPPLFGSPIAMGSGNSPAQVYVQVPEVAPVQPFVAVPAITTAGIANLNAGSNANTVTLAPAAQSLVGEVATPSPASLLPLATSPAESPAVYTSTPGTFAAACLDIPPPQSAYTCAEQASLLLCLMA